MTNTQLMGEKLAVMERVMQDLTDDVKEIKDDIREIKKMGGVAYENKRRLDDHLLEIQREKTRQDLSTWGKQITIAVITALATFLTIFFFQNRG